MCKNTNKSVKTEESDVRMVYEALFFCNFTLFPLILT